ncbi:hypothetical protein AN460_29250 [Pseudomonas aeruginosa]|nr:hypothetical protein AN460_29250 [Pseudomonas aeruginosa]
MAFVHGKLAKEIFVNLTENISAAMILRVEFEFGNDVHQFAKLTWLKRKAREFTVQDSGKLYVFDFDFLHGFIKLLCKICRCCFFKKSREPCLNRDPEYVICLIKSAVLNKVTHAFVADIFIRNVQV